MMSNTHRARGSMAVTRRDLLKLGGLAGAAALASCSPVPQSLASESNTGAASAARVALRFAHISDMHIEPSGPGMQGFRRALQHVHALNPAVDFVLNTGDCVFDSLEADKARTQTQWDAFHQVLKDECTLPIFHAIGNHDVWGWGLPEAVQSQVRSDALFGKEMALQQLELSKPYYRLDRGGWRFLVLDSTHTSEGAGSYPYTGKLDDEQFQWLVSQLDSTPDSTPVCIVSHIPILAACEYLDGDNETTGNWIVPGAWMHIDARRLVQLFWKHRNVRLCISGHSHQVEDLRYHGVNYLTDGAICGNWWYGAYFDFPPGYVIVTLYEDGSSAGEFVAY